MGRGTFPEILRKLQHRTRHNKRVRLLFIKFEEKCCKADIEKGGYP
jgi:hypothetical protein